MLRVRLLLLVTVTIWGWTFVATKVMLRYVAPVELLGLRMLIGLPLLLFLILARHSRSDFTRREYLKLLLGSCVITAHFLIQITGLKYTSATNTGWLIASTPLVLAVLSRLILSEKIGRRMITGIAAATLGVLLLVSHGDFSHLGWLSSVGDWLVLSSAFTWAIYTIITRDLSSRKDPATVTFTVLLPTGLICLGYMIAYSDWRRFAGIPVDGLVALFFLGIPGTALAQWFWQVGIGRLGAAKAGVFLYLEPLATTALAVPYMGESFGAISAMGGLFVLLGVYLAERK